MPLIFNGPDGLLPLVGFDESGRPNAHRTPPIREGASLKALTALLSAALLTAALVAPSAASGGFAEFASTAPDASNTVTVTFTMERNHAYYLSEFDADGVQVCYATLSRLDTNYLLGTGETSRTLSCTAQAGVPVYGALFQVEHSTNLTPTFTWTTG